MESAPQPAETASGSELSAPVAREDLRLVSAVLQRDRKATAEFVDRYADSIYGYVRHRLIPRADLVDDLVQETFLAAWESLPKFQGQSSLRTWLLGIARHKVEDHYRSLLRATVPIEEDVELPAAVSPQAVEASLDRERLEARVQQVLGNLPEAYSLVLLWRYWEKRSARDIANQIGKTEKAVERLLARARAQFKRSWDHA